MTKILLLIGTVSSIGLATSAAMAQDAAAQVLAAQVRAQGLPCTPPMRANRDPEYSRPGEAAWILNCRDADYRVRLIPNQAAIIEPIVEQPSEKEGQ